MPARRRRAPAGQRGSSAIELVLLTPVLIALVFAVIQAALLWHAHHVVLAAAQQGDRLARSATRFDPGEIRAATVAYLRSLGADLVENPTVTVTRDGGWVTVSVTGRAASPLPGAALLVRGTSRGPVESFRPDTTVVAP